MDYENMRHATYRPGFSVDNQSAPARVRERWTETAATPIIIADMFNRAGCS